MKVINQMKKNKPLIFIFLIALLFRVLVLDFLPIRDMTQSPLFIFDLLGKPIFLSWWLNLILGFGNITVIYILVRELFSLRVALFSSFLYAISFWTVYVELSGSNETFFLFALLVLGLGVLQSYKRRRFAVLIISISSIMLFLSSIFYWVILPILFIAADQQGFIKQKRILMVTLTIMVIVTGAIIYTHQTAFRNHLKNQLTILSDIGIINTVNAFRGETQATNFNIIGKIIENRYLYFSEKLFFNFIDSLTPTVYFTPQAKLLGFSFAPPILLGFLLPFIFGLKQTFRILQKYSWSLLSLMVLITPSVFSKTSPDLVRLTALAPVLFAVTGLGLETFYLNRRKRIFKYLIILTFLLVAFQLLVSTTDIILRESVRLEKFT